MRIASRVGLFIVVSAALSLAECGPGHSSCTGPHCPYTAVQAIALQDSEIYFPGSQVLSRTATDGLSDVNGEPVAAYVTTALNTPATESTVAAWYQHRLISAGWKQTDYNTDSSGRGFYAFTISPPLSKSAEVIFLDFRRPGPAVSGTDYTVMFGVAAP